MSVTNPIVSDLHVHSSVSDGMISPYMMPRLAQAQGIRYLAITDHDTVAGYQMALSVCTPDVEIIPALEISTETDGRDVHLLGYFVDPDNHDLLTALDEARTGRKHRTERIIDRLQEGGFALSAKDLQNENLTMNRTNIARLLVRSGQAKDIEAVFDELIGRDCPYFVERKEIDTLTAIELVRGAGGLPVMAHPWLYDVLDLINRFATRGLAGVEAYHPEQSLGIAHEIETHAAELGLLVTGGSDWHGDTLHGGGLGSVAYPREHLEAFLAADPRR